MPYRLRRALDQLRSVRGVAPAERWPATKTLVAEQGAYLVKRARRRISTGQVRVVQETRGPEAANRYFWLAPWRGPVWFDVQNRIEHLARHRPEAVDHFVLQSLQTCDDPVVIVGLARHPYSRNLVRDWLGELSRLDAIESSELLDRTRTNRLYGGALIGAGKLLLEPDRFQALSGRVIGLYELPTKHLFGFIDSVSFRPALSRSGGVENGGTTVSDETRHRLVVTDSFEDKDSVALLLPGAAKVTLLAMNETFGMSDFSMYRTWPGVGDITVEHIRSRITRFSQAYIDLHLSTRRIAERVAARLSTVPGLVEPASRSFLEVEVADFLFFQALKVRALEELLRDETIDHVVLAVSDHRSAEQFLKLMAGVRGLLDDPRLEIVSISRSAYLRGKFWEAIDLLTDPWRSTPTIADRMPEQIVVRKFEQDAQRLAESFAAFSPDCGASVYVVTANNEAYNESTAGYVQELRQNSTVRILHLGRNATSLVKHLDDLGIGHAEVPIDFVAFSEARFGPLADVLRPHLHDLRPPVHDAQSPSDHAANWAFRSCLERLTPTAIGPALLRMNVFRRWLEAGQQTGQPPDLIVLTPQRHPGVGAVAPIAREFGVPTLALEPNVQDANYCRYIKVAADHYGVLSDYFRRQASHGFGIEIARTTSIGSSRLVAPAGYDPDGAQRAARRRFRSDVGISLDSAVTHLLFLGQPSDWRHVSRVWSNILDAARDNGCNVLLKPHPEESPSRAQHYLEQARAHGMSDRVVTLSGNAAMAIDLCDIVLTAYSTGAIDAAIRQTPAICVTDGDVPYPVDLPAIVDIPLARSSEELSKILAEFRADPEPLRRRARSLLDREDQFVSGPGPRLRELVGEILAAGSAAIRDPSHVPTSLFLDGPHPQFPV